MKHASTLAARFTALGLVASAVAGCSSTRPTQAFETAAIPPTQTRTLDAAPVAQPAKQSCDDSWKISTAGFPFVLTKQLCQ